MNTAAATDLCEPVSPLNEWVLVDDDLLTVEIVSWIVGKSDHRSRLFVNPDEALHYLKENTPRLLVVDFYMPRITGLDFISELHGNTDLSQTQIFLCSAVSPPKGSEALISSMNVAILEKQLICDRAQLSALLDRYLG